jgi:hypothetical protein
LCRGINEAAFETHAELPHTVRFFERVSGSENKRGKIKVTYRLVLMLRSGATTTNFPVRDSPTPKSGDHMTLDDGVIRATVHVTAVMTDPTDPTMDVVFTREVVL